MPEKKSNAKQAMNEIRSSSVWFNQIREEILWHYTSIDVLYEFAKPKGYIYATHFNQLNDASEINYGRKIWNQIISDSDKFSTRQNLIDKVENSQCMQIFKGNTFVFSLTCNVDRVCHWKTYTPNGGIAIGFDVQKLKCTLSDFISQFKEDSPPYQLLGHTSPIPRQLHFDYCIYGDENIQNEYNAFINKMLPQLSCPTQILNDYDLELPVVQEMFYREAVIPFAKHESFEDEREVRIFYSAHDLCDNAELIAGKKRVRIIPSSELISKVIISPHGNVKAIRCYAEYIKSKFQLDFTITNSSSPYRG